MAYLKGLLVFTRLVGFWSVAVLSNLPKWGVGVPPAHQVFFWLSRVSFGLVLQNSSFLDCFLKLSRCSSIQAARFYVFVPSIRCDWWLSFCPKFEKQLIQKTRFKIDRQQREPKVSTDQKSHFLPPKNSLLPSVRTVQACSSKAWLPWVALKGASSLGENHQLLGPFGPQNLPTQTLSDLLDQASFWASTHQLEAPSERPGFD